MRIVQVQIKKIPFWENQIEQKVYLSPQNFDNVSKAPVKQIWSTFQRKESIKMLKSFCEIELNCKCNRVNQSFYKCKHKIAKLLNLKSSHRF